MKNVWLKSDLAGIVKSIIDSTSPPAVSSCSSHLEERYCNKILTCNLNQHLTFNHSQGKINSKTSAAVKEYNFLTKQIARWSKSPQKKFVMPISDSQNTPLNQGCAQDTVLDANSSVSARFAPKLWLQSRNMMLEQSKLQRWSKSPQKKFTMPISDYVKTF